MLTWRSLFRSTKSVSRLIWRFSKVEKYKIQLSIKAKNDYKKIINYLKNELLEPSIANR